MARYFLRRLGQAIVVFIAVVTIVFLMSRLAGDPAVLLVPSSATKEEIAEVRASLGLDRSLWDQYVAFVVQLFQGDFGDSFRYRQPAMGLVFERLPATLMLAIVGTAIALVIGLPAGMISALRKGTVIDRGMLVSTLIGQCLPPFYLGILLILVFGVWLRWLPAYGYSGLWHLLLPSITFAVFTAALLARVFRDSLLDELSKDYVRTARSKGVSGFAVLNGHVLRNASIPVVTLTGVEIGSILGGSVVVEKVFSYPGIGGLAYDAIATRDFPIVQAYVIVVTIIVLALSLAVDLLYKLLDPTIEYR